MFRVVADLPSRYEDNKMPILDLKVWVNSNNMIMHEFYMKPVAYKGLIRSNTGLSSNMIRNIIFNEGLRRLNKTIYSI